MTTSLRLALILAAALLTSCAAAQPSSSPLAPTAGSWALDDEAEDVEEDSFASRAGYALLTYIPSRVFDVLDIVRARVRVGPGMALGVRATELADFYLGTYATVWAGLPGPRNRSWPKLPFGLESKSGLEVSAADITIEGGLGPGYGDFEVGLGFQAFIIGVDVGVEPFEVLDLVAGLVFLDPRGDDW